MVLQGRHIALRALEPEDLQFLFQTENNVRFWEMSHTQVPFSKHILKRYLENAHQDIYESKQLRLMIEEKQNKRLSELGIEPSSKKTSSVGFGQYEFTKGVEVRGRTLNEILVIYQIWISQ